MNNYFYGLQSEKHLTNVIKKVCEVFGGGINAVYLMIGTAAAETHYGRFPDRHPEKLGVGVMQCDEIALIDIQQHIRINDINAMHRLGYDIDNIQLHDLAYDPLLAVIIARLVYKRKPQAIPAYHDIYALGNYWKDHYNSHHPNAAGTPDKFVSDFKHHAPLEFQ